MKRIEAIFKPYKLDEVREALSSLGVNSLIASEVEGCGRRNRQSEDLLGRPRASDLIPKIKVEIVVSDALSGPVSLAIIEAARTGSIDDGHIFISQVMEAFSIGAHEAPLKAPASASPQPFEICLPLAHAASLHAT